MHNSSRLKKTKDTRRSAGNDRDGEKPSVLYKHNNINNIYVIYGYIIIIIIFSDSYDFGRLF